MSRNGKEVERKQEADGFGARLQRWSAESLCNFITDLGISKGPPGRKSQACWRMLCPLLKMMTRKMVNIAVDSYLDGGFPSSLAYASLPSMLRLLITVATAPYTALSGPWLSSPSARFISWTRRLE